jgi:hypothetical protein
MRPTGFHAIMANYSDWQLVPSMNLGPICPASVDALIPWHRRCHIANGPETPRYLGRPIDWEPSLMADACTWEPSSIKCRGIEHPRRPSWQVGHGGLIPRFQCQPITQEIDAA